MIGPRFTEDPGEIAANPPPVRATIFLDPNRGYGYLNVGAF